MATGIGFLPGLLLLPFSETTNPKPVEWLELYSSFSMIQYSEDIFSNSGSFGFKLKLPFFNELVPHLSFEIGESSPLKLPDRFVDSSGNNISTGTSFPDLTYRTGLFSDSIMGELAYIRRENNFSSIVSNQYEISVGYRF